MFSDVPTLSIIKFLEIMSIFGLVIPSNDIHTFKGMVNDLSLGVITGFFVE